MIISRRAALAGMASGLLMPGQALAQLAPIPARLRPTPTVDLGPFYPIKRPRDEDADLSLIRGGRRAIGELIEVSGRVLDRRGHAIAGARIEIWQANAAGRYAHQSDDNPAALDPAFQGFGRMKTDRNGRYRFVTIKPGAYPDGDASPRPPHIHFDIAGASDRITSQMIFPGEPLNETDDVLAGFDRTRLTATAIAKRVDGASRFGWDIVLPNG